MAQPASRRGPILAWAAAVAATLAVVAVGLWSLGLQRDLQLARETAAGLSAVLEIAGQPGSQTAVLTGEAAGAPTGIAAVAGDGRVALVMRGLDPTEGSEVYEAWVIAGDGAPVPIGSFTVGGSGAGTFATSDVPTEPGIALAVTLEPAPGATVPTLPIVASGQAGVTGPG